jgi:tripartite-type tricarboxylate transporter receptor subunit TctC
MNCVLPLPRLVLLCLLLTPAVQAQSIWPQHSVKFILPLGGGSGVDIVARLFADRLSKRWGQPIIVENKPGGDGIVAISTFVAVHDDHVLLCAPASTFVAHPYLHDNLPYEPDDLQPIARMSDTVVVIAVPAVLEVHSLDELVALARAQPGKINWAGVTGAMDFLFEGFLKKQGILMPKVPYRNLVDGAADLAEGRVQVFATSFPIVQPYLQSGKVRLLAVTNSQRASIIPGIPTAAEVGYPELTLDGLIGLFGPPNMPIELRERLARDIRSVADGGLAERLAASGQILNIAGPEEFATAIAEQRANVAAAQRFNGPANWPLAEPLNTSNN